MSMTEGDVRRIVREEIAQALKSLAVEAERAQEPYETGELMTAGLEAVTQAAERAIEAMQHTSDCDLRLYGRRRRCSCPVEEDSFENRWIRHRDHMR